MEYAREMLYEQQRAGGQGIDQEKKNPPITSQCMIIRSYNVLVIWIHTLLPWPRVWESRAEIRYAAVLG
jgi:hypothetical protein